MLAKRSDDGIDIYKAHAAPYSMEQRAPYVLYCAIEKLNTIDGIPAALTVCCR